MIWFDRLKMWCLATPLRVLGVGFAASRMLSFFPFHINMQTDHLPGLMHIVWPTPSPWAPTLWAMSGQPVGFQLIVDALTFLAPFGAIGVPAFVLYTALGWLLCLALYHTLCRLRVMPERAAFMVLLFSISSSVLLFERILLYTYPAVVSVAGGLFFLLKWVQEQRLRDAAFCLALIALPCWLHSFFQPVFPLVVGLIMLVFAQNRRWAMFGIVGSMVLFATLPALKNGVMYGHWISSSWGGLSLARVAAYTATPEELARIPGGNVVLLEDSKDIKPALVVSFTTPAMQTGLPALDAPAMGMGRGNFQSPHMWVIGDAVGAQTRTVLRHVPEAYGRGLMGALFVALHSPSDWFSTKSHDRMLPYDCLWQILTTGASTCSTRPLSLRLDFTHATPLNWQGYIDSFGWRSVPFLTPFYLLALLAWGIARVRGTWKQSEMAFWLGILCVSGYVWALAIGLELGENQRLRFYATPALFLLAATLGDWLLSRYRLPAYAKASVFAMLHRTRR